MGFIKLVFSKLWTSKTDFPTYETSEDRNRADLQLLHDETKIAMNALIDALEASSAAANLGFNPTSTVSADNIQSAIENVQNQIRGVQVGELVDGVVTNAKIADQSITTGKLASGAVTAEKMSTGAVTTEKMGAGAVTAEKIADKTISDAKLSGAAGWYGKKTFCISGSGGSAKNGSISGTAALKAVCDPLSAVSSDQFVVPDGAKKLRVEVLVQAAKTTFGTFSVSVVKNGGSIKSVGNIGGTDTAVIPLIAYADVTGGDRIAVTYAAGYSDGDFGAIYVDSVEIEVIG